MIARSTLNDSLLSPSGEQALATLLGRAREAAAERAALPPQAAYWQAAETRSAMAIARANAILGGELDPRTVLAVLVASVARTDLGGAPSESHLVGSGAQQANDPTTLTSWLLGVTRTVDGYEPADLYESGATAATEVLAARGVDDDLLASAWTAICGIALLEVVAERSALPQEPPTEAEVRLVQRVTCHCLATNRGHTTTRLGRLVGTDRRTMAAWMRYGSPTSHNIGHLVPARHCAALVGISPTEWRMFQEAPESRSLPGPVHGRRTAAWDEGEVMAWFRRHTAFSCDGLCRRHAHGEIAELAVGGGMVARGTCEQPARRWLRAVP